MTHTERQRGKESSHLLVYSTDDHNGGDRDRETSFGLLLSCWQQPMLGHAESRSLEPQSESPTWMTGTQVSGPSSADSQGVYQPRARLEVEQLGVNSGTLIQGLGIPSGILTMHQMPAPQILLRSLTIYSWLHRRIKNSHCSQGTQVDKGSDRYEGTSKNS